MMQGTVSEKTRKICTNSGRVKWGEPEQFQWHKHWKNK